MKFSEATAEEARRFQSASDNEKFLAVAKPLVNLAYLDVGKSWEWPQLLTTGSVLAIPKVTGTCAIVQDQQTVQVTGATIAFKGRFFRPTGGANDYRILYVDTTTPTPTLTLDQPIIEASATVTFEIFKRYYTMPTEVRRIMAWDKNERQVVTLDQQGLRQNLPDRTTPLSDTPFQIHGIDDFTDDYTTGSISTAGADSSVIIGSGTAWLSNAAPGNILNVGGTQDYRIKRVETDTRIVLYNKIKEVLPAATTYTISVDSALTLRPYAEFSTKKVIRLNYIRSVFDMVHDDDRIILSNEAKLCVLDFAQAYIKEALGQNGWETVLLKAQARLEAAQAASLPVRASFKMFPPLVPRGMGRR